jgi:hypothetical protein
VSRFEALDAADFNRIVTAINRNAPSTAGRARRRRLGRLRRPALRARPDLDL